MARTLNEAMRQEQRRPLVAAGGGGGDLAGERGREEGVGGSGNGERAHSPLPGRAFRLDQVTEV